MGRTSTLVLGLVVALAVRPSTAQDWGDLPTALVSQITGLWQNGEMELMGHYCYFSVSPSFCRWELYFNGSMWCPGWAPFNGEEASKDGLHLMEKDGLHLMEKKDGLHLMEKDGLHLMEKE
ncbi:unnamed protein product, partial [Meganyctiphanes norvegica]